MVSLNVEQAYAEYAYFGNGTLTHVGPVLDQYYSIGDTLRINLFYPVDYVTPNSGFYSGISFGFEIVDPPLDAFSDECNVSVVNDAEGSGYDVINIFCAYPLFNPGPIGSATYDEFILSFIDEDGIALSSTALPENLSELGPHWESATMTLTYDAEYMGFPIKTHLIGEFTFPLDSDGDGIIDEWEMHGLDYDLDGIIDIDFPGKGADYRHKDLFLEIDYMENHKPTQKVIDDVIAAFADAPQSSVNNPDGMKGINLHIDLDESVPHQDHLILWSGFDSIKNSYFGTNSERVSETEKIKKYFYRYGIFIHNIEGTGSSGRGELPGNDFVVSLGGYRNDDPFIVHKVGSVDAQTSTLMHEFGHTLGLRHGGVDHINCKPNYLSIMSYTFQFKSLVPSRPLDYSREKLASLDENNLVESVGIESNSFPETIIGSDNSFNNRTGTSIPIDYNNDGDVDDSVSRNITNLKKSCQVNPEPQLDILESQDDWSSIVYDFRGTASFFGDGDHPELSSEIDEMTQDDLDEIIANTYPLLCIVPESGDWVVTTSCELALNAIAPANVILQNNSVVTIAPNVVLTIPSGSNVTIENGSGILIKSNAALKIKS